MAHRNHWFERNKEAEDLENAGHLDEALQLYEQNAKEGCDLSFTYMRIAAIHRNRGAHGDEAQALQRALALEKKRGPSKRLVHLETKLERAKKLEVREDAPKRVKLQTPGTPREPTASPVNKQKGCLRGVLVLTAGLGLTGLLLFS